jgi:hypothetical protein
VSFHGHSEGASVLEQKNEREQGVKEQEVKEARKEGRKGRKEEI